MNLFKFKVFENHFMSILEGEMKQGSAFEKNGIKKKESSGLGSRQKSFQLCALGAWTLEKTNAICSFVTTWKILTLWRVL